MKYLAHIIGVTFLLVIGGVLWWAHDQEMTEKKEQQQKRQQEKRMEKHRQETLVVDDAVWQMNAELYSHFNQCRNQGIPLLTYYDILDSVHQAMEAEHLLALKAKNASPRMVQSFEHQSNGLREKYAFNYQAGSAPFPPSIRPRD